jgi:cobyrinic acid a,c-diamide synthase
MSGVVIGGTHSGCGKTTVTLGVLGALSKKGLAVQAFKAGPDFIDSGLHGLVTGRPSRNLDLWMCGEAYVRDCYSRNSTPVDMAVVEGVMGLYDGSESTASLASALHLPVVLVVDGYGMAETAGALIQGFVQHAHEKGVDLAGVIFNRVGSDNHYGRLCRTVQGITVLGYLPRDVNFDIPHRHLGLMVAEERPITEANLEKLSQAVLNHVNIDLLVEVGKDRAGKAESARVAHKAPSLPAGPVVAVAYDRAFSFYYQDNLDLLRDAGARIVYFSPLADVALPQGTGCVYMGGGYPESHAEELSRNVSMRRCIKDWADSGKPLYAECGGLMYLTRGIHDFQDRFLEMAGVFPFETNMKMGRSKLGYRRVTLKEDCLMGKKGQEMRGHEFHYSEIMEQTEGRWRTSEVYSVQNGSGQGLHDEGYRYKNTLGSYIHIHFGSGPGVVRELINKAQERKE